MPDPFEILHLLSGLDHDRTRPRTLFLMIVFVFLVFAAIATAHLTCRALWQETCFYSDWWNSRAVPVSFR